MARVPVTGGDQPSRELPITELKDVTSTEAYRQGRWANHFGFTKSHCPYWSDGSRSAWLGGWDKAENDKISEGVSS